MVASCGVEILTSTRVETISEQGILATDKNGERKNIGVFDTIVLSMGAKPFDEVSREIGGKVLEVYVINRCKPPALPEVTEWRCS